MMSRNYTKWLLVIGAGLLCGPGCANGRNWGWGWGSGQGTVDRQKARAVYHDPYPINDLAPEVAGGRPREFAQPMAEPVRNQYIPPYALPQNWAVPRN